MVDLWMIEASAEFTAYLWCSIVHRKHHKWTHDYRRDCGKCKSWYFWPKKYAVHQQMEATLVTPTFLARMRAGGDVASQFHFADPPVHPPNVLRELERDKWPDVIE